jgi:hypothetical protein
VLPGWGQAERGEAIDISITARYQQNQLVWLMEDEGVISLSCLETNLFRHLFHYLLHVILTLSSISLSYLSHRLSGANRAFGTTTAAASAGKVTQVIGAVVDVQVS